MANEITIRFEDNEEADEFLRRFGDRQKYLKATIVGEKADHEQPELIKPPSYHDLFITTKDIKRKRISDLGFGLEVTCNRVGGWSLCHGQTVMAGEYAGRSNGLKLDVGGHVIVDSLTKKEPR